MADHEVYAWVQGDPVFAPCDCAIGQNHLRWERPVDMIEEESDRD